MAHIEFEDNKYNIPEGSSAEDCFDALKQVKPELANAKLVKDKDGDNYKAVVSYGKKG